MFGGLHLLCKFLHSALFLLTFWDKSQYKSRTHYFKK